MQIVPVPVHDEPAMRRWFDVYVAARAADHPELPLMTFPEVLAKARAGGQVEREDFWVGRIDGTAVGAYRLRAPLRDNLEMVDVMLAVHPDHRRRGHGRALLEHALGQAQTMGRHRVLAEIVEPVDGDGRAAAVAIAAGFRRALSEAHRVLDLRTIDPERLARLEAEASRAAQGYELVSWTGPTPDEHVAGYAALVARMSTDAPLDDLDLEPETWDADRVRAREATIAAQGRTLLVTAARHVATGELVAYSDIAVTVHDPANAFQWDTLVRRDHRGHRLGLLVKVANLRLLLEQAPAARRVHTWNADSNAHMVAINEELGFVVRARQAEWQLDLRSRAGAAGADPAASPSPP